MTLLVLLTLPFLIFSQEFVDDIYYNDDEVNYDFLDIYNESEDPHIEESDEDYMYDENFTYSDRIERFENNYFDYYWNYNLYYSPWDHHYYNYHGINGWGWPNYGWGYSNYYGWGWPNYGWGYSSYYGWGWPYHTHTWNHAHHSYYDLLHNDESNLYYGHRGSTNTNQSTQTEPYVNTRIRLNESTKNREKNINYISESKRKKVTYQKRNESIKRLNKKTSKVKKNSGFKQFLSDIIQENSSNRYNKSKSNNYNSNNKSNNYNRSNNNSTRSKSNSSRGGRKP